MDADDIWLAYGKRATGDERRAYGWRLMCEKGKETKECFTSFNHVGFFLPPLLLPFLLAALLLLLFWCLPEHLAENYWKILYATKLFIEGLTRQDDGRLMSGALLAFYSFRSFFSASLSFYCSCVEQFFRCSLWRSLRVSSLARPMEWQWPVHEF